MPETLSFAAGVDGGTIVCSAFGNPDAQPVLLLHGGGQTRHTWKKTCELIADAGFYAVAVDLKGHGESYWDLRAKDYHNASEDSERDALVRAIYPGGDAEREEVQRLPAAERERLIIERAAGKRDDSAPYRFRAFSKDIDNLLKMTGWDKRSPVLVGASLGGMTALATEAAERGLLGGIVLVDVTPRLEVAGVSRVLDFMLDKAEEGFATIQDAAVAIAAYTPQRKTKQAAVAAAASDGSDPLAGLRQNLRLRPSDGRWVWHWDPMFLASSRRRKPCATELDFVEADLMLAARRLTERCHVLLVRGRETDIVSVVGARRFLDAIPHASFVDIADAGHMVVGDQNDVFGAAVADFLKKVKATQATERSRL